MFDVLVLLVMIGQLDKCECTTAKYSYLKAEVVRNFLALFMQ
jgi:hypothetical protein